MSRLLVMVGVITTTFALNQNIVSPVSFEYENTLELMDEEYIARLEESQKEPYNFISTISESIRGNLMVGEQKEVKKEEKKDYVMIDVIVSYYTSVEEENGNGLEGRNAIGGYLSNTSIAIPRVTENSIVKYGSVIEFEDLGEAYMKDYNGKYLKRIADDCGSPKHIRIREDGVYRMDIYCPKFPNESKSQYIKRVNNYGKYKTTAKVYLKNN